MLSKEAIKEKYVRAGHLSLLHRWWARRPLIASRAAILASLIPNGTSKEEKDRLLKLLERTCTWQASYDTKIMNQARKVLTSHFSEPPRVLDSFAGGGSVPFEALRLGCDAYAVDLNPVAYIIQLCGLVYPQKYNDLSDQKFVLSSKKLSIFSKIAQDLGKWGYWMEERMYEHLNQYYDNDQDNRGIQSYFWARTIHCSNPSCGREVPLLKSLWLKKNQIAVKIIKKDQETFDFQIVTGSFDFDPSKGTISLGNLTCPFCNQRSPVEYVRQEGKAGRFGVKPIAIVETAEHSTKKIRKQKIFRTFTEKDIQCYNSSLKALEAKLQEHKADFLSILPTEPAPRKGSGPQRFFTFSNYGFETFDTLFNPRQKLFFIIAIETLKEVYKQVSSNVDPDYAKAICTYLALVIDRMTDFNSILTTWRQNDGGIRNLFERPTISMKWSFAEVNPFCQTSTVNWTRFVDQITETLDHCTRVGYRSAHLYRGSAIKLPYSDEFFDLTVIDPPYYDYIVYADISDFFYVWLKRSVGWLYPEHFSTPLTPKSQEIIHNRHRHGGNEIESREFYEQSLVQAFSEIRRVLKPEGLLVIMFTHRSTQAWEALLKSVLNAGFYVTASWPIQTELGNRLQAIGRKGQATVNSTIFLVCRKQEIKRVGYFEDIRGTLKEQVASKLKEFWQAGIRGADFFISSIGPLVEIFGQYSQIQKLSGESVSMDELFALLQSEVANFVMTQLFDDFSTEILDKKTQFYLIYKWAYQSQKTTYDDINKLAKAIGVEEKEIFGRNALLHKQGARIHPIDPFKRMKEQKEVKDTGTHIDRLHLMVFWWSEGSMEELKTYLSQSEIGAKHPIWRVAQALSEILPGGNKEKQILQALLTLVQRRELYQTSQQI